MSGLRRHGDHVGDTWHEREDGEDEKGAAAHPRRVRVLGDGGDGRRRRQSATASEDVDAVKRGFPANGGVPGSMTRRGCRRGRGETFPRGDLSGVAWNSG